MSDFNKSHGSDQAPSLNSVRARRARTGGDTPAIKGEGSTGTDRARGHRAGKCVVGYSNIRALVIVVGIWNIVGTVCTHQAALKPSTILDVLARTTSFSTRSSGTAAWNVELGTIRGILLDVRSPSARSACPDRCSSTPSEVVSRKTDSKGTKRLDNASTRKHRAGVHRPVAPRSRRPTRLAGPSVTPAASLVDEPDRARLTGALNT